MIKATHDLIILSWIGISPEAVHYMGRLQGNDSNGEWKQVEIEYIIDDSRASELNKVYKKQYPGDPLAPFRAGMRSGKFDTVKDVIKAGRAASKIHFPKSRMKVSYN